MTWGRWLLEKVVEEVMEDRGDWRRRLGETLTIGSGVGSGGERRLVEEVEDVSSLEVTCGGTIEGGETQGWQVGGGLHGGL